MNYRSTRQESALPVYLKLHYVEIKCFHLNSMGLGINNIMLHTIIVSSSNISNMVQIFESVLLQGLEFLETSGSFWVVSCLVDLQVFAG